MSTSPVSTSLGRLIAADAGWFFSLYPDAGEGGGGFRSSYKPNRAFVAKGSAADPERAAAEAGRRARSKLRRYCAANRLNRLGTLTYAKPCHDPQELRSHLGAFFRDLRSGLGGSPLPYAWVPEWHKTDHGLHAHFAVGQYIRQRLIRELWGRGHVHIKLLGDLPVGSGALSEARKAAGYLSKYVTKTFTDPESRVFGLHRYDVVQGFQPVRLALSGDSPGDVLAQASGDAMVFGLSGGLGGRPCYLGAVGCVMVDQRVLAEWVEATCAAQGVPVRVTDPGVLARVGVLMGAAQGTDGRGSGRSTAAAS